MLFHLDTHFHNHPYSPQTNVLIILLKALTYAYAYMCCPYFPIPPPPLPLFTPFTAFPLLTPFTFHLARLPIHATLVAPALC